MTDRRAFVHALGAALASVGLGAFGQTAGRVYTIGVLRPTAEPGHADQFAAESLLPAALAKLGYVRGRNLTVESRYAGGDVQRLAGLARELVQMRVDVIVAVGGAAVVAAKAATTTIPIVIWGNLDPVALGYVASLARPGGNVTGVLIAPEGTLAAKKLELLKEAVPRARRIAVLVPEDPNESSVQLSELRRAAATLGVLLTVIPVGNNDYAGAFVRIAATRPDALYVLATTYFVRDRKTIIELSSKYRLPTMWEWREQVVDGGLMAYGSSLTARNQRIAEYVDRILKGADAGAMPVDQPTNFELVINGRTARDLGLAIPRSLLLRADEVIP